MDLEERVYSVLVATAAESLRTALSALLPESKYSPVCFVSDISAAKRASVEREFDFVIINSPLPDDLGIRFAIDLCTSKSSAVLLLVRAELHDSTYDRVAQYGVFTLPKPISKQTFLQALAWMASTRERLRRFEKSTLTIEEKMEEIRLVNRAKWLLISELHMDEPQAHRYIEKQAMDRRVRKLDVALSIILLVAAMVIVVDQITGKLRKELLK